jgi:hypothetical protein
MTRLHGRRRIDPLLPVALGVIGGLVLTWLHHPRVGMYAIAAALGAAALLRLLLAPSDAGLLVVRSRLVDVVALGILGAAVAVVASVTPFPPPAG